MQRLGPTALAQALCRQRSTALLLTVAIGIGALYAVSLFNIDFLLGRGFWSNPVGPWLMDAGDAGTSVDMLALVTSYTAYVHAPWQWPIFHIPSLGPPVGTSGIFVDFLPIIALTGKAISRLAGTVVLPYGAWMGACLLLSALFATLVMIAAGQRSLLAAIAASLFAVSAPVLLYRFGHVSLWGQFPLIAALWLYLRDGETGSPWRVAGHWALLLVFALLINAYIFAMVGAFYAASWLDRLWRREARWWEPAPLVPVLGAAMFVAGFIGRGNSSPFSGNFGLYSMNLLSPLLPQRSVLFPGMWPIIDATGGQYEGFNYLGAGGLFLLAMALLRDRPAISRLLARHPAFALIALGLTIFAISQEVHVFGALLLTIPAPSWLIDLCSIFRSSGRMFWPVNYALLLGGLVLALRREGSVALTIPLLACLLQIMDTEGLRRRDAFLASGPASEQMSAAEWGPRLDHAAGLVLSPVYTCTMGPAHRMTIELNHHAAVRGLSTNSVYDARAKPDCAAARQAMLEGPWRTDALYVLFDDVVNAVPEAFMPPGLRCARFPGGRWCLGEGGSP